jgi:pimeloyl-ACP methyl ester carboxylesterase
MAGSVEDRAARLTQVGIPADIAASMALAQGAEMGRAILSVYRSARQPVMADAGRALEAAARPGLSLLATEDPFVGSDAMRHRAAERAGAHTEVLAGLGHWWMLEDPTRGAAALTQSWNSVS